MNPFLSLSLLLSFLLYILDYQDDAAWIIKIFGWIPYCSGACTPITAAFHRFVPRPSFCSQFSPRNYREIRFSPVTGLPGCLNLFRSIISTATSTVKSIHVSVFHLCIRACGCIYTCIYIHTSTINLVALPSVMKVDWVAAELIEFFFRPRLRPNQQLSGEFG